MALSVPFSNTQDPRWHWCTTLSGALRPNWFGWVYGEWVWWSTWLVLFSVTLPPDSSSYTGCKIRGHGFLPCGWSACCPCLRSFDLTRHTRNTKLHNETRKVCLSLKDSRQCRLSEGHACYLVTLQHHQHCYSCASLPILKRGTCG